MTKLLFLISIAFVIFGLILALCSKLYFESKYSLKVSIVKTATYSCLSILIAKIFLDFVRSILRLFESGQIVQFGLIGEVLILTAAITLTVIWHSKEQITPPFDSLYIAALKSVKRIINLRKLKAVLPQGNILSFVLGTLVSAVFYLLAIALISKTQSSLQLIVAIFTPLIAGMLVMVFANSSQVNSTLYQLISPIFALIIALIFMVLFSVKIGYAVTLIPVYAVFSIIGSAFGALLKRSLNEK